MAREKKQHGKFHQNVSATFGALLTVIGLILIFCCFYAGELKGKLLCETDGAAGKQAFVYDFSSRKKQQLYVEGYSDIQRVTGFAGDCFYCCALRGQDRFILKVENSRAVLAIPTQSIPGTMTEADGCLYVMLGEGGGGALVKLDPDAGTQVVLQQGLYAAGGFCLDEKQSLYGKWQNGGVLWCVTDNGKETEILHADASVRSIALFGGYAYFCDDAASRFFRVSAVTGEREDLATVPLLAQAKDENAPGPAYAFSSTKERQLVLLANGRTPLFLQSFLMRGRFLFPVVTFGLIEKERTFSAIQWI